MEELHRKIIDSLAYYPTSMENFNNTSREIKKMYLDISSNYIDELIARGEYNSGNIQSLIGLSALVIGIHLLGRQTTITRATAGAEPNVKKIARELYGRFKEINKALKKEEKKRQREQKKQKKIIKKKMAKQAKEEGKRAKKAVELLKLKQSNRTRNTFCKNTIEYITQEDVEDIPTKDLTFIKLDKAIYCLDKDSFKNMIKYAKGQKVRGACKPAVPGQPLNCKWFYPINIGQNVYIPEVNYEYLMDKHMNKRKFSLTYKRSVDFTTGLHMMSEKTGKDWVYTLSPDEYSIEEIKKSIKKKIIKKKKSLNKIIKSINKLKLNVKQLKAECKKKGIKGYSKWKKATLQKNCLGVEQAKKQAMKSMTVKELRAECKKKGIKGYSKLKKAELQKKCLEQNGGSNKKR